MGFKDEKKQLLECLASGNIGHAQRNSIDIKNLLATGQVTAEYTVEIVARARGNDYELSEHHAIKGLDVHILKTQYDGKDWYIKWYYLEPNCVFISVHN